MRGARRLTTSLWMFMLLVPSLLFISLAVLWGALEKRELDRQREGFVGYLQESQQEMMRHAVDSVVDHIETVRGHAFERLQGSTRNRALDAYSIVSRIYEGLHGTVKGTALLDVLVDTLGSAQNDNSFANIIIYDTKGRKVLDAVSGPAGGANAGREGFFAKMSRAVAETGEGAFSMPSAELQGNGREGETFFYVRLFAPLSWIIGARISSDELDGIVKQEVAQWARSLRFSDKGYVWAVDSDLGIVFHPQYAREPAVHRSFAGDIAELKSPVVPKVSRRVLNIVRRGGSGFVDSAWDSLGKPENPPAASYVRLYPPWNWIIGAGFDENTLGDRDRSSSAAIQRGIGNQMLVGLAVLLVASACIFLIGNSLIRRLQRNVRAFEGFFRDGARIDPARLSFAEMREMGSWIDGMVAKKEAAEQRLRKSEEMLLQSQKMEAMGRLAGGVAHDFNNLLTAILGYAEMLTMNPSLDTEAAESVGEIRRVSFRAASLVQQLLSFSHKQVTQKRSVHLDRLVADMESMLHMIVGGKIALEMQAVDGVWAIQADPGQIEQTIINCAVNARDAMPGGGTLTIEIANWLFSDAAETVSPDMAPGPYVMLAIRDTGCGMDAEARMHLFEPFYTTKEPGKGTGLGLSIVYGIVRQHGGVIDVESAVGQGTVFRLFFPRVDDGSPRAPDDAGRGARGGETILLVEDDEQARSLARATLASAGYTVVEAADGKAARALVQESRAAIHLMVTDVLLPDVTGDTLYMALRQRLPAMAVVYMSGSFQNAAVIARLASRGNAVLPKPFSAADLCQKARQALDRGDPEGNGDRSAVPQAHLAP